MLSDKETRGPAGLRQCGGDEYTLLPPPQIAVLAGYRQKLTSSSGRGSGAHTSTEPETGAGAAAVGFQFPLRGIVMDSYNNFLCELLAFRRVVRYCVTVDG